MEWKSALRVGFLGVLAWNLAWLFLCVVLIFDPELLFDQVGFTRTTLSNNLLRIVLYGGIGSIAGFLYDIARCVIKKSPALLVIHKPYFAKPFKGMLAGALGVGFVYVIWGVWGLLLAPFTSAGDDTIRVAAETAAFCFVALACGNREHLFFEMLGRLLKKVLSGGMVSKEGGDVG